MQMWVIFFFLYLVFALFSAADGNYLHWMCWASFTLLYILRNTERY